MNKSIIILAFFLIGACAEQEKGDEGESDQAFNSDYSIVNPSITARIPYLLSYPVDSTKFPRSMEANGQVRGVPSKDWTSGFYPGSLLSLYQLTGDSIFLDRAVQWVPYIEKEQWNGGTHDMGFKVFCSVGQAYKITRDPHYKDVIVQSAKTLSTRFNPAVGSIKSWDFVQQGWQFPVIIDNMMNLELLFEATILFGDSTFYKVAETHAKTTMKNHYREDGSAYHVIDYDPGTGAVLQRLTHQGYAPESVWSRGQAWGLYGFTMAYRYTNNPDFLHHAIRIADFIINHPRMPEDGIPYWDMEDPLGANAPRDVSAASVIASACYELFKYSKDDIHMNFADKIMESLGAGPYILKQDSEAPFILAKSVGNWPKKDEMNLPISYADYYFLEALLRKKGAKK